MKLPAGIDNLCPGGGGRYLIIHLKTLKKLAIFDANAGKITKYIPALDENTKFAAGANKLVVVSPDQGVISRWNLETFERELTKTLDVSGTPSNVVMGWASAGPVVIGTGGRYSSGGSSVPYYSLETLAPLNLKKSGRGDRGFGSGAQVRVAANGKVLGVWETGVSPSGLQTYVLSNDSVEAHYDHTSVGYIVPSPDGRVIYTGSGVYTNRLKRVGSTTNRSSNYMIPSLHGDYYLKITLPERSSRSSKKTERITLHMTGDDRPLVTIQDIDPIFDENDRWSRQTLTLDKRLFFIPDANLIVQVTKDQQNLRLHRFNLDEALEKSGVDYLMVASRPPLTVDVGQALEYQVAVKSKRGGVKYKLESGPKGMKLDATGKLQWTVPKDEQTASHNVIITITDASGQEIFHTFDLELPGIKELEAERKRIAEVQRVAAAKKAEEDQRLAMLKAREDAMRKRQEEMAALKQKQLEEEKRRTVWLGLKEAAIAKDDQAKLKFPARAEYPMRLWTDSNGSAIKAKFVDVFASMVLLQRPNGSEIAVPGSRLSEADMQKARENYAANRQVANQLATLEAERVRLQGDEASRKKLLQQSAEKMGKIALAMQNYHDTYRRLPGTCSLDPRNGEPLLSWRVLLLPFLGENELYERFKLDEPWYSEHNRALIAELPDIYKAPGSNAGPGRTNYVAVVGQQHVFSPLPTRTAKTPSNLGFGGMSSMGMPTTRMSRIIDGTSNTATFVEAGDRFAATWTRPDEVDVNTLGDFDVLFALRDNGLLAAMVDGTVTRIHPGNSREAMQSLFRYSDGKVLPIKKD